MSSSLPQLLGNYITHNRMYGLAVFCRKDPEGAGQRETYQDGGGGEGGGVGGGEGGGGGGQENFNEEGELLAWESDLDSEDERFSSRRSISVALVESNCMSRNGGKGSVWNTRCLGSVIVMLYCLVNFLFPSLFPFPSSLNTSSLLFLLPSGRPLCEEQRAVECRCKPCQR